MSNEMRGEDTILGTALGRAIESQPIRSTPFERSRVAVRMAGGGRSPLFPVLAAAAAVVLGLALGAALLGQRGTDPGGVAASPTPSPDASASPGGSPSASPTASPEGNDRIWVYFARDQLPVVGAFVRGTMAGADRIGSRLRELHHASGDEVPNGTTNAVALLGRDAGGGWTIFGSEVRVEGDLATVEFGSGTFNGIRGAAQTQAVLEQLVYTITEEPGIRRALIKEQGKNEVTIDQLVIDKPLTREDVLPYEGVKTEQSVALEDDPRPATLTTKLSNEPAPGLTRFEIVMTANAAVAEGFWSPRMSAELIANADERALPGKWVLKITLPGGTDPNGTQPAVQAVEGSPVRATRTTTNASGTTYELGLDDARPWRVSLEPVQGAPAPPTPSMRLIVDIGGHPQSISESVAVYEPKREDTVQGQIVITGAARAFEAHVAYRLKDSGGKEVATGFVTASLGTSPVWGTFQTKLIIPAGVSGVVTLEVFWPSPRDGADVGMVAIPLRAR